MRRTALLWALLVALLAACSGDDGVLAWRDARMTVPDGWVVFEQEDTRLSLSNVPLGALTEEPGVQPEGDVVAMFFTHEPGAAPPPWRDYASERDIDIEVDTAIEVGGVPATRFEFLDRQGGSGQTVTREMVVVVPSREVVLLAQPVPPPGEEDVTAVYDRAAATFDAVLDSISWGAPVDGP